MKRSRKLIFPLFLLFLLFGGASLIFDLIYKYPVTYIFDKIVWSIPVRVLFVIVVCLLLIWKQCKWMKNSYIMSFNQWLAYGFAFLLFFLARYGDDWSFLKIEAGNEIVKWHWQPLISDVKLIDVLWLSLLYPLSAIGKLTLRNRKNWIYPRYVKIYDSISDKYKGCVDYFKKDVPQNDNAFFEEDIALRDSDEKKIRSDIEGQKLKDSEKKQLPDDEEIQEVKDTESEISLSDEESQQYHELTKVLVPKLVKQKFVKAFSIGIIGPYGNGKSSLVNHLRDKFDIELGTQRFEIIDFLPAYSHKPEQISTDFFTLLASSLKKYHGSLNQSMLSYAAKLIELGVNGKKDIQGLLKPADWFSEKKSAIQTYEDLKKIFTQIDIKIIVIIDDVDRLGKEEIFEVLRLIRNTANFPNTIFIVAYDKDYVVKTIDQNLMYLDKYFQYELFVPPHRSEELLQAFSEMVLRNKMGLDAEQLKKLKEVINVETLNKTLLDKFVLNYRDVKVLTNIYCTNLCLLTEEIDYIDLLHFTLMNRYFPSEVRYIYNNFGELFEVKLDHQIRLGIVTVLKLRKYNSLSVAITVDSFIEELKVKTDSQKMLFKRLFLLLFGITDSKPSDTTNSNDNLKVNVDDDKRVLGRKYSTNKLLSIRNAERTHIYFELFLQKDDVSNVKFSLKIGTDKFENYIDDLLKNVTDQQNENLKEKIKNKLEYYNEKLDTKVKIENAINVAPLIGADMTNILFYSVNNYENLPKDLFKDENDFANFFKEKLWENKNLTDQYVIQTLLRLIIHVKELEKSAETNIVVPPYMGLTKDQVKDLLIIKTKVFIKSCLKVDLAFLIQLSKILDSDLYVPDADIGLSNYLYTNTNRLFEYLKIVEKFYKEGIEFSSAIFKVFTDKDKFEKECFGKFPRQEKLIREFHHLLELHDIRKGAVNISEFIPFYFSANRVSDSNGVYRTIYLKRKPRLEEKEYTNHEVPNKTIVVSRGTNSIDIIEGTYPYQKFFEKFIPAENKIDPIEFLKNSDDIQIISIQTDEEIDLSIIPYCKFNKMIEELKVKSINTESVI